MINKLERRNISYVEEFHIATYVATLPLKEVELNFLLLECGL